MTYSEHTAKLSALEAEGAALKAEVARLNQWADGFSDAQIKERMAGESLIKELQARVAELEETLRGIRDADPTKWDPEVQDQFREWAQSRARFTLKEQNT